jgi:hypothetical protein
MFTKSLKLCFVTLLVSSVAGWASTPVGPARIQGIVKDSKGQAIAGAEVHIQAKDGSGLQKIVRTLAVITLLANCRTSFFRCSWLPAQMTSRPSVHTPRGSVLIWTE